jgi:uncharacterized protein
MHSRHREEAWAAFQQSASVGVAARQSPVGHAMTQSPAAVPSDPEVDLSWLLLSPPLMSGMSDLENEPTSQLWPLVAFTASERDLISAWLHTVASDPTPLIAFLNAAKPLNEVPMRIGRYAERLLQFFLVHGPTHQLVAANIVCSAPKPLGSLPKSTDRTTIGELDFLLRDADGHALHWELALKFFVANDTPAPRIIDYMGPDGTEALTRKITKMTRQLEQCAPAPYQEAKWQAQAFTRGYLFYRQPPLVTPPQVHPAHLRGFWIWSDELANSDPQQRWVFLPRAFWLAPRVWQDCVDADQLLSLLAQKWQEQTNVSQSRGKPLHLAGLMVARVSPIAGGFVEEQRGFVMPR